MKLQLLADALGNELHGDGDHIVSGLASIEQATASELAFAVSSRYSDALRRSNAGAVIVPEALGSVAPGNYLVSNDPYASYAKASWLLKPARQWPPGIHPSAVVDKTATVHPSVHIGSGVVIGANTRIDSMSVVLAQCVIGANVSIGKNCKLFARVSVYDDVKMGEHCRVQSGAVIGSEGFGYAWTSDGWSQIQQTGGVIIGDRVHIGANTTIDCGAIEPTCIADGVILDNQIQIAHNVRIGENTAIAGCVGIAGSTRIGARCQIGGACNIVGHLSIADGVVINAASLVTRSIKEPGRYGSGTPLQRETVWRRSFVTLGKLDDLLRRVRKLERSDSPD